MNLAVDTADPADLTYAGYREQGLGHVVVGKPGELGLVETAGADGVGDERGTLHRHLGYAGRLHL